MARVATGPVPGADPRRQRPDRCVDDGVTRPNESRRAVHQATDYHDADHVGRHGLRHHGVSSAAGQRPADRRFPDDPGHGDIARRQPRDDGVVGGDAAREAVLDDCRCQLDELDESAGQHQHHAAVRSQSQHRRGGAGRAGGDRQGGQAAAAADADAAVVQKVNPGDASDAASSSCARRRCRCRRSTNTPKRPSPSASRRSSASPRSGARRQQVSRCTSRSIRGTLSSQGIGIDDVALGDRQRERQLADRHRLRSSSRRIAVSPTASCCAATTSADDRRVSQRHAGAPGRDRARLRRRRERQGGEPGSNGGSRDRTSRSSTTARHQHRRGRRRRQGAAAGRSASKLPPSVRIDVRARSFARPSANRSHDVKFTLLLTLVLVVAGDLRLPAQSVGHHHSQPRPAVLDRSAPSRRCMLLGYSLDNLSLMALDPLGRLRRRRCHRDAREHLRHMEMGKKPMQAAFDGSQRDRLHHRLDDAVAGGGVHPGAVHGRRRSAGCSTSSR